MNIVVGRTGRSSQVVAAAAARMRCTVGNQPEPTSTTRRCLVAEVCSLGSAEEELEAEPKHLDASKEEHSSHRL